MKETIKILVVDDEAVMRNLFTDILQDEGYVVTTVCNGKEALEAVKEKTFDIAFVDVHMPVMGGMQTLCNLKKIVPETTIVMMDSVPTYLVEELKKGGAITCLHKPFSIDEVRQIVNNIIEKKGQANG